MKKIILVLIVLPVYFRSIAQYAARIKLKEPIEGICDDKNVYVPFPMLKGQEEAKCPVSKKEIVRRLNTEVTFLKDSATYEATGIVNIIINCKGEVVRCEMDNKTKSPELDKQIVAVFSSLGQWKPGKINGDKVDTSKLWSFKIEHGQISFD